MSGGHGPRCPLASTANSPGGFPSRSRATLTSSASSLLSQMHSVRAGTHLGEPLADPDLAPSSQPDPAAALERWRLVHRAISTLDRPYREVLILRDVEAQTGDEV
jgi:DNA-directed RNA polymerase specialized sigma24 family protein